ncbi:hypothetical protein F5888DRAFT_1699051 [Russula emetica]|nr:hypothetical protein F5888DRAFT_1699051 [Russula emetica]
MFKVLRRISSSIYPRPDRPWSDDATSNAPSIGRKRRINDEDADEQEMGSSRKRRGQLDRQDTSSSELGELGVKEVKGSEVDPGVKQVTRGVKEVELEDKKEESRTDDGKGVSEEASKAIDGESSVAAPLDPTHATPTQNDDDLSQGATVTDDKVPGGQSEEIVEAPSNDPPEVDAPTSTDSKVPSSQDEEKETLDTTPGAGSDEVGNTRESVESSPEP